MVLKGHQNAVLDLAWTYDELSVVSCGADKSVALWDLEEGCRVRKSHHSSVVNSCSTVRRGAPLYVSGSDDSSVKLWDSRVKGCVQNYVAKYSVMSVAFNDDASQILSAGVDNNIKVNIV